MCVCISFFPSRKHRFPNHLHLQPPVCKGPDRKPYTLFAAEQRPQGHTDHEDRSWVSISRQAFPKQKCQRLLLEVGMEERESKLYISQAYLQLPTTSAQQCHSAPRDNRLDGFHTLRLLL